MIKPSARLEVNGRDNDKQEFLLNCELVRIGRAADNSLVLSEQNVSRYHAQIAQQSKGYLLTDLESSGGTFVNNTKLPPKKPTLLKNGDSIRIGACELRFFSAEESVTQPLDTDTTFCGSVDTDTTVYEEECPSLPQTHVTESGTPMLRVTTPDGNKDFPLTKAMIIIGRDPGSDIVINLPQISSQQAQLRQYDGGYEITDLGSRNGLSYRGRRITQHRLEDGDVLQIGSTVTLTYQEAAQSEIAPLKQQLDLGSRDTLSIGRDPQNDTVIEHPTVSRFHAQISRQDGEFTIVDLNSSNGSFVNGKRINSKRSLRPGDAIRIGPQYFSDKYYPPLIGLGKG